MELSDATLSATAVIRPPLKSIWDKVGRYCINCRNGVCCYENKQYNTVRRCLYRVLLYWPLQLLLIDMSYVEYHVRKNYNHQCGASQLHLRTNWRHCRLSCNSIPSPSLSPVDKNIERHTAHTIVSWPNPKQWVIHSSPKVMAVFFLE